MTGAVARARCPTTRGYASDIQIVVSLSATMITPVRPLGQHNSIVTTSLATAHQLAIYNLEFEAHGDSMIVAGYRFTRHPEYRERIHMMNHIISSVHEFDIKPTTGSHVITGNVELPPKERRSKLPWQTNQTELKDVELLLSLFTGRDVFSVEDTADERFAIIRDPRVHYWGGTMRCSIPYEASCRDPMESYDIGFEKQMNRMCRLIRSRAWQGKYKGGYVVFLAREAFLFQTIEKAFANCWTIWEHLYTVFNPLNLTPKQVQKKWSAEKIAYILEHYGITPKLGQKKIEKLGKYLSQMRNDIVHFGRMPRRKSARADAKLFIELTAYVMAIIFELPPSNVMNVKEHLAKLLTR